MSAVPFFRDAKGNLTNHGTNHDRLRRFLAEGLLQPMTLLRANDAEGLLLLRLMACKGSSAILNYGEDTGEWECSWITGGERYTGVRADPVMAIWEAAAKAYAALHGGGE